uniref:Uncharacterized protein n=1 Tax=Piliocolobus tephrosceles TaxID=591936 RepID=A0A8C9HQD0_9PRIM
MIEVVCNNLSGEGIVWRRSVLNATQITPLGTLRSPSPGCNKNSLFRTGLLNKWYTIFKDHIYLGHYEIQQKMKLEGFFVCFVLRRSLALSPRLKCRALSQFIATSTFQVQAILLPQPPE